MTTKQKEEIIKQMRLSFEQYSQVPVSLRKGILQDIYLQVDHNNLYYETKFLQCLKQYGLKPIDINKKHTGKIYKNWRKINRLVLLYKSSPNKRKLRHLKKRFIQLLGGLYCAKIKSSVRFITRIKITEKDKKLYKEVLNYKWHKKIPKREIKDIKVLKRKKYSIDVDKIDYKTILLQWTFGKTNKRQGYYGKNLLENYNSSKGKYFSNYFNFIFKKDRYHLAYWSIIKTFYSH
jgi:hypothetical protein